MSNSKRFTIRVIIFIFFLSVFPLKDAFPLFRIVKGIESVWIKRIAVSPFDKNIIYIASDNTLFKSKDGGRTFVKTKAFVAENIQHLFFDPHIANVLYLATSRNLFRITKRIDRLFSVVGDEAILSAVAHRGKIYVGTIGGAYVADEELWNWTKLKRLTGIPVYFIDAVGKKVFFATARGVYVSKDDERIERTLGLRQAEEGGVLATVIKVDMFDKNKVWLGTNEGIYRSVDGGSSWTKLYIAGINSLPIFTFAQTPYEEDILYIGTSKGFFRADIEFNTATQIFEGISSAEIFWIAFVPEEKVLVATSKGLFESEDFVPYCREEEEIEYALKDEPTITEVQQIAMRYNEVHPDKIRKWRNGLRLRALLPEVSLDYDKTITTALGATYDYAKVGPRDWGVSLKWDAADLIWDTHQDDVDTRSRLNTQLRLDILNEINRVYFERARLKLELISSADSLSETEACQKRLRLQELTAILDGYTGGYFSRKAKENSGKR
ncbi:MAG: hypothetical protein JSW17_01795 [Candidatus Omnitrophota bacterium]|nr:MAG: hypothetical protein JSW17_01795 [Candidatus Omnitrophota bacterium]